MVCRWFIPRVKSNWHEECSSSGLTVILILFLSAILAVGNFSFNILRNSSSFIMNASFNIYIHVNPGCRINQEALTSLGEYTRACSCPSRLAQQRGSCKEHKTGMHPRKNHRRRICHNQPLGICSSCSEDGQHLELVSSL